MTPRPFPRIRTAVLSLVVLLALPLGCSKHAHEPAAAGQKPLFYRHPMQPDITSPVPAKDDMGMDYIPVYAEPGSEATGSTAAGEQTGAPPKPAAAPALSAASLALGGVAVVPVVREPFARSVRLPGTVTADEARRTEVVARFAGWLEGLSVGRTGERVRRGQTLAELFSPELVAGQEEYLRARETAARFAASTIPEVVEGGREIAEAARRRLALLGLPEAALRRIEQSGRTERTLAIPAPTSGWVTRLAAVRGARVEAGATLFEISDLSTVFVEASLPEEDAALGVAGREATLTFAAVPGTSRTGRLVGVLPMLDTANRTLTVRIAVPNGDLALKPGMSAFVELAEPPRAVLLLPDASLLPTGERTLAFVETAAGRFSPREVEVGARANGRAEILSGVREGEKVAAQAAFLLDAESRLRGALPASPNPRTPSAATPPKPREPR